MAQVLYACFADPDHAEKAVGALLDHGVLQEDISLIANESWGKSRSEHKDFVTKAKEGITTTTGADAASGAGKGAGIGLVAGILGALASLFIPGFGLVTGGGALATAIGAAAGTTAAGAVAGGVHGFLKDQGVPEDVALRYSDSLTRGGAIIAVNLPSGEVDQLKTRQILSKYEAAELSTHSSRMIM